MKVTALPEPEPPKNTKRIFDTSIDPLVRLKMVGSTEFEEIVSEWAASYLAGSEQYVNVAQVGGSKDSGRDIVAYIDQDNQIYDLFQCKHYKNPLTPSDYMAEFGKLCYYTMTGEYEVPRKYFIVASNGIGQDLRKLVEKPENINRRLIETWNKYCAPKGKITADGVPLTDGLKTYIRNFDFKIVADIAPATLLEQFSKTIWFKYHFGGGLRKREKIKDIPAEITSEEYNMAYIKQLLKVYSKHENKIFADGEELRTSPKLYRHLKRQRECFHHAKALERFSRDELLNDEAYVEVKDQVFYGISYAYEAVENDNLERVDKTVERAQMLPVTTFEFKDLTIQEKSGICHDLVNDDKIRWSDDE